MSLVPVARPCPWCGASQETSDVQYDFNDDSECSLVYCCACGERGPERESGDEALKAWNTRPVEDKMLAFLDQIVDGIAGQLCPCLKDEAVELVAKIKGERAP